MVLGTAPGEQFTDTLPDDDQEAGYTVTSEDYGGVTGDPETDINVFESAGYLMGGGLLTPGGLTGDPETSVTNVTGDEETSVTNITGDPETNVIGEAAEDAGVPNIPWQVLIGLGIVGAVIWVLGPVINLTDTLAGG